MSNPNPFDRTHLMDFDLPAVGEEDDERAALRHNSREEARGEAVRAKSLTEGRAFKILAEFVNQQREARINQMLLTPITEGNKDEMNFMRGETAGLMLALRYARAIAEGAEATLELLREEDKLDARSSDTHN